MLFSASHRFHPRSQQDRERDRREAASRAQIEDLADRLMRVETEQRVQLKRIADIQQQLDAITKLLKQIAPKP
jgi:uncharacterized sporulation protein YeaH/YhbH (DUF444 family)